MSRRRSVVFVQFSNPAAYPPVMNAATLLDRGGWRTAMVGAEVSSLAGLGAAGDRSRDVTIVRRRQRIAVQYAAFLIRAFLGLAVRRPAWVYASDLFSVPIAAAASYWPGLSVAYHEHDLPVAVDPGRDIRVLLRLRRRVLRRADVVVVPSESRKQLLGPVGRPGRPVVVAMNAPLLESLVEREPSDRDGRLRLVFQGAVTPARLPLSVVDAVARIPDVELTVIGYGTTDAPRHPDDICREAQRLGVADRVHVRGALSHGETLANTALHDVGIVLLAEPPDWDANLNNLFGASNKVFEYLGSGLVLLTLRTDDLERHLIQAGLAVGCASSTPEDIVAAIEWIRAHGDEARAMAERGRALVESSWNYSSQFEPVRTLLEHRG